MKMTPLFRVLFGVFAGGCTGALVLAPLGMAFGSLIPPAVGWAFGAFTVALGAVLTTDSL